MSQIQVEFRWQHPPRSATPFAVIIPRDRDRLVREVIRPMCNWILESSARPSSQLWKDLVHRERDLWGWSTYFSGNNNALSRLGGLLDKYDRGADWTQDQFEKLQLILEIFQHHCPGRVPLVVFTEYEPPKNISSQLFDGF